MNSETQRDSLVILRLTRDLPPENLRHLQAGEVQVQDVAHEYQFVLKIQECLLEMHLKLKNLNLKVQTVKEKSRNSIYRLILFLATFLTYSLSSLSEMSFRTFLLTIFLTAASRTLHRGSDSAIFVNSF